MGLEAREKEALEGEGGRRWPEFRRGGAALARVRKEPEGGLEFCPGMPMAGGGNFFVYWLLTSARGLCKIQFVAYGEAICGV